jgi:hypothetical protein
LRGVVRATLRPAPRTEAIGPSTQFSPAHRASREAWASQAGHRARSALGVGVTQNGRKRGLRNEMHVPWEITYLPTRVKLWRAQFSESCLDQARTFRLACARPAGSARQALIGVLSGVTVTLGLAQSES